jgi:ATP-dependent Clp protease adaptor protein ClpS
MKTREEHKELLDIVSSKRRMLVLHNDDHNTFEFVVDSLIKICRHDEMQAEQCAMIAHFNGKCEVRKGIFEDLKLMKDELLERGISVTID